MADTETRDEANIGLEARATDQILAALLGGQSAAISAVVAGAEGLAAAVDAAAARLLGGAGRLVYVGAGTSGRLAVLDGVELTPTFGWPRERLVFALAGGLGAMTTSVEGAEDDADAGRAEMGAAGVGPMDVAIAVAASGRTPYTCAALEEARARGAVAIGLSCNAGAPLLDAAEFPVLLQTGAEVLAGSTRLGAGTAQKAALNSLSTALMARLFKIHEGYMVDMLPSNAKLVARAEAMIADLAGVSKAEAARALEAAGNRIKLAVLIAQGAALEPAEAALVSAKGDLAAAKAGLAKA